MYIVQWFKEGLMYIAHWFKEGFMYIIQWFKEGLIYIVQWFKEGLMYIVQWLKMDVNACAQCIVLIKREGLIHNTSCEVWMYMKRVQGIDHFNIYY